MSTASQTAIAVGEQMLPALIAAAAIQNPNVAAMAPVILELMAAATKLRDASLLTSGQLEVLFADIAKGVQSTHDQWVALNLK
jgi:hypothetical protein